MVLWLVAQNKKLSSQIPLVIAFTFTHSTESYELIFFFFFFTSYVLNIIIIIIAVFFFVCFF